MKATKKLVSRTHVWPGMQADITKWVRECRECQMVKINKHVREPLEEVTPGGEVPMSVINADLVGPFPPVKGFTHLLTIIDRNTGYPATIPLAAPTTSETIRGLNSGWIQYFGWPDTLVTDQGKNFTSHTFRDYLKKHGVQHRVSSPAHPQSNGLIERWHRSLKTAIRAVKAENRGTWIQKLPEIMLALRTAPKEDGVSPAERLFRGSVRLAADAF